METTTDQEIRNLIARHVFLTCENELNYSRLKQEAIGRIEREYIILTGCEIEGNPEHETLLEKRMLCC